MFVFFKQQTAYKLRVGGSSSDGCASDLNPSTQGIVEANSRDVVHNLNEETLPGIDRQATATGGITSSRAGVAAGIARRGAEDRVADISASIRGDAYNRGLSLAQGDRKSTRLNSSH